ncbi:hypothetical protein [Blastococcus sp. SYSU DS0533]
MRRSLLRSGLLPAATALALLAGCGGSDGEDTTASDATTSSAASSAPEETSAPGTSAAAGSEFCTEAAGIRERLTGSATAGNPADLPQLFRDAAQEIREIEAPEELATSWSALADGAEQIATTLQDIDLSDPNALTTLQERLAPLEQELGQASDDVERYLVEECGLALPTEETAPTT